MDITQHGPLQMQATIKKQPLTSPFRITGYTFSEIDALMITLVENGHTGRGEAEGVYYHHDTPTGMLAQVEKLRNDIERGITREQLLHLLPAGGARNALDCALWDLEAKRSGQPVWKLAGLEHPPQPLQTTFTLGADDPAAMVREALSFAGVKALKLKLTNDDLNAERVRAVREAHPDAWLMVDANQGFTRDTFANLLPALLKARVALVEQPFPVGKETWLDGLDSPIPIAADESVQDHFDLSKLVGRVHTINIKLDKCGGLTEALAMAQQATELGYDLMVGNMSGTSLAMAPAFVLGQRCAVVDLDGPVYLRDDPAPRVHYEHGTIWCPDNVWGGTKMVA